MQRYWFVQYNPWYFFSAQCVFTGVCLVAGDLESLQAFSVEQAQLGLFSIIQLYELLLIAGAAFLIHRNTEPAPTLLSALHCQLSAHNNIPMFKVLACQVCVPSTPDQNTRDAQMGYTQLPPADP